MCCKTDCFYQQLITKSISKLTVFTSNLSLNKSCVQYIYIYIYIRLIVAFGKIIFTSQHDSFAVLQSVTLC